MILRIWANLGKESMYECANQLSRTNLVSTAANLVAPLLNEANYALGIEYKGAN